uniref:ES1 protein homolog, mitochondrial-like n=1 Tax=Phallusia mammillata TaxID=59560 RepID=A0A6F9DE71_9ASCI|nr:ES1 protein homolog, mitochondrial-like [Phallusia mammillata]
MVVFSPAFFCGPKTNFCVITKTLCTSQILFFAEQHPFFTAMQSVLSKFLRFAPNYTNRLVHTGSAAMSAKVAVVLSGCGVYDGSEVHEASACLVHLSRAGADVTMFAPDIDQMHTIDHTKGEEMKPNRNVLCESARIARGNITALSQ